MLLQQQQKTSALGKPDVIAFTSVIHRRFASLVLTVYPAESWALRVRAHECYTSAYKLSPVRLSVRPSHEWISQKRLKLGSCNCHHSFFAGYISARNSEGFHPERGRQTRIGWGKTSCFLALCFYISKTARDTKKVSTND